MPYTRNGTPQPDTGFTVNDVVYPKGWIANPANKNQWSELGIAEVAPEVPYNREYYWGWSSDGKTLIDKQLEDKEAVDAETGEKMKDADGNQIIEKGLKTYKKAQQNEIAKGLLLDSDWMVIRASETDGKAIPSEWLTYRQQVRTTCNERQAKIDTASTTTELKGIVEAPSQIEEDKDGVPTGKMITNPATHLPNWPTAPAT
tara:strand:- start:62 stop:667 length:606 start_codon:yes stop_codon:yes gene_type:complete